MGLRELNAGILQEAREVTGRKKLRQKDIMEWSTGPIEAQEGEELFFLPKLGINVAVLKTP